MTLRERMERAPAGTTLSALGGCFALSCVSLLGDGYGHLVFFLPLAVFNGAVGAWATERAARAVLVLEAMGLLGALGYQLMRLDERFPVS